MGLERRAKKCTQRAGDQYRNLEIVDTTMYRIEKRGRTRLCLKTKNGRGAGGGGEWKERKEE